VITQDPTKISEETEAILARVRRIAASSSPAAPALKQCPRLRADEWRCSGGAHLVVDDDAQRTPEPRACPLVRYLDERARLAAALELCGYKPHQDPLIDQIGPALFNAIDKGRDAGAIGADGVMGLRLALKRLRILRDAGAGAAHIQAIGTTGTAKTMALLGLYFSWLWNGDRCFWVSNNDLRTAAQQRLSFDEDQQNRSRDWLIAARKWPILFLSDLGAQAFDSRVRAAGGSALAGLLLDLLDGFAGQLAWDSNLDAAKLRGHADFGPRIVSRLMADRGGLPLEIIALYGADQRQHALRQRERTAAA
jgi:hypothetical protein